MKIIQRRLARIEPEVEGIQSAVYYAGSDRHKRSAFGRLPVFDTSLLQPRDRLVFPWLAERNIPCAWAIGGGFLGSALDRRSLHALHRTDAESVRQPWPVCRTSTWR